MKKIVRNLLVGKGIYYLLMIATIGLLLAADFKWSP
jgi:hypothetical protein